MQKNIKKVVLILTIISSLLSTSNVLAVEANNDMSSITSKGLKGAEIISDRLVSIADKYISFDKSTNSFKVDTNGLSYDVSQEEYEEILGQIANTNNAIKQAMTDEVNVCVADTEGNEIVLKKVVTCGRGVNSIRFYWNYARIFISADNLSLAMQVGFSVGSIYAPARIVQLVCASLGIFSTRIDHGIWFDYNYFIGILCGNWGFQ